MRKDGGAPDAVKPVEDIALLDLRAVGEAHLKRKEKPQLIAGASLYSL